MTEAHAPGTEAHPPGTEAHAPGMIDSHHHVWDVDARDHAWLSDLPAINRTHGLDDLRPLAAAAGIEGTVLVQVLGEVSETAEFLVLAGADPLVRGVVGWVDLTRADVADTLATLRAGDGGDHLVGIRHLVQSEPDPAWLLHPEVRAGIAAVGAAGLAYDLLIMPEHLAVAAELVGSLPDVSFVVDHLAKPHIAAGEIDDWAVGLRRLGQFPNVACKVSGILTEAGDDFSVPILTPYVQVAVDAFGPARLMLGSDWPVSLLATGYQQVVSTLVETLRSAGVTGTDLEDVCRTTAERWYHLSETPST